jgi:uncharacterized membrane protein
MSTLLISIAAIAVYLIFDFIRDILRTKRIFEKMIASGDEFLIDYDNCPNISDMIALYIVKVRNF